MEQWRAIKDWEEFYEVSDRGRVRSRDRVIRVLNPHGDLAVRRYRGRELRPGVGSHGYLGVTFTAPGRRETHTVHTLVAKHFVDGWFLGAEVLHDDGVKLNCRAGNLKWGTTAENSADCTRHGQRNSARGTQNGAAKLSDRAVEWIRVEARFQSHREMGLRLGVAHGTVGKVLRGASWQHVK